MSELPSLTNVPELTSDVVRVDTNGPVFVVTITRPDRRNAADAATANALEQAFEAFENDSTASVAILTGQDGYFCAGADLQALAGGEPRPFRTTGPGPMGPTRMRLSKPVIAAIEGPAVAGGLELAIWCDLRVVASDATLGVYCRRFGVPLIDLGTIRLPRLIGQSRAMDLILTGRGIDGVEAERIGLANRVTEPGEALSEALTLATELSSLPQRCMRNDRLSAIEQWDLDEESAMRNEVWRGRDTVDSGETLDGAARFTGGAGRHGSATVH